MTACTLAGPWLLSSAHLRESPGHSRGQESTGGSGVGLTLCFQGRTEGQAVAPEERSLLRPFSLPVTHTRSRSRKGSAVGLERSVFESEFNKVLICTGEERGGEETQVCETVLTHTNTEDQRSFRCDTLETSPVVLTVNTDVCTEHSCLHKTGMDGPVTTRKISIIRKQGLLKCD